MLVFLHLCLLSFCQERQVSLRNLESLRFLARILCHEGVCLLFVSVLFCDNQACALDPLLDDSVAFARRLKRLDLPARLFVVDSLPHGFLNLTLTSAEATRAYNTCTQCLREALLIPPPAAEGGTTQNRGMESSDGQQPTASSVPEPLNGLG